MISCNKEPAVTTKKKQQKSIVKSTSKKTNKMGSIGNMNLWCGGAKTHRGNKKSQKEKLIQE